METNESAPRQFTTILRQQSALWSESLSVVWGDLSNAGAKQCRTATPTAKAEKDPLCDADGARAKDSVNAGDVHL